MAQGVGLELKKLREATKPKISIRSMAARLDMTMGKYVHYEDIYKGEYLPVSFVEKILPILVSHGIPREDVIALSGAPDIVNAPANIDAMRLGLCLRAVEDVLSEGEISLSVVERSDLVAGLYMSHLNNSAADTREAAYKLILRHLSMQRPGSES